HGKLMGKWRLAGELRPQGFEWALHLPNSFESALISYLAGIPQRVGYNTDARGILLTRRVPVTREIKKRHQVDYYIHLVKKLGLDSPGDTPLLTVSARRREEGQALLESLGIRRESVLVGFSPGAKYGSAKEWDLERYAGVARRINKETGAGILIFGNDSEKGAASLIAREAGGAAADLTGKTTLGQAMAILSLCRLLITNDSGLMHVAAALGVPLVAIFGSTDPARTGPRGKNSRIIYKAVDCAPCLKKVCPQDRKCMRLITVDEVFEAAKGIWN
ncbi:MAG TPA: lipopolysaccharide heptosyltransferase II, partial [Thermodesulfobacteriota bacterium]|nr:lipopolysaccharide heptosyltransferase II [Thermodesulfobacteriota bacterium]